MEHPSIRRLLQQQILNAWRDAFPSTLTSQLPLRTVPLYRLKHPTRIVYRCSLALRLALELDLSADIISHRLVTSLIFLNPSPQQPILEFTYELGKKEVIDCVLCDRSLVLWLDQFPQMFLSFFTPSPLTEAKGNSSVNLFPIQYTHARCCSLLRLGDLDGLIEFNIQQLEEPKWSWKAPNPISWGFLEGIYEYRLIGQVLNVIDSIDQIASNHYITLANQLCQAFWDLERHCRIWGEVKHNTPELAQARLGLVAVTQLVLRWLLQEKFKITAWIEM